MKKRLALVLSLLALLGIVCVPVYAHIGSDALNNLNDSYSVRIAEVFNLFDGMATDDSADRRYSFVSSDENIARVDESGIVSAVGEGDTDITVTGTDNNSGRTSQKTVRVNVSVNNSVPIAHRGAFDCAPQVTLAAYEKAFDMGYNYMEGDLRVGKDNSLFFYHDDNLLMCTRYKYKSDAEIKKLPENERQLAEQYKNLMFSDTITLENRKDYPILSGDDTEFYPVQYIPTLDELFACLKEHSGDLGKFLIHIRSGNVSNEVITRICEKSRDYGLTDKLVLIGNLSVLDYLEYAKSVEPDIGVGYLFGKETADNGEITSMFSDAIKTAGKNNFTYVMFNYEKYRDTAKGGSLVPECLTQNIISAHKAGLKVICYSMNTYEEYLGLSRAGADGLVCNKVMFPLDKKHIRCRFSVLDGFKNELPGNFKVLNSDGKTVASFRKTAEKFVLTGRLSSQKDYTLAYVDTDGEKVLEEFAFKVLNTPKTQDFKFTVNPEIQPPLLIAHRGFSAEYPQNTVEAALGAVKNGFDGFECDVWEGKDGTLLVCHDSNTKKILGVDKNIWEFTNSDRLAHPIISGSNIENYDRPLYMPTLEQMVKVAKDSGCKFVLHIKKEKGYTLSAEGRSRILDTIRSIKSRTVIIGAKDAIAPFTDTGFEVALDIKPKDKKELDNAVEWCADNDVNNIVFIYMDNLKCLGSSDKLAEYMRKQELSFSMYTTKTADDYNTLRSLGAYLALSDSYLLNKKPVAAQPVTKPVTKPAAKPATQPATQPVTETAVTETVSATQPTTTKPAAARETVTAQPEKAANPVTVSLKKTNVKLKKLRKQSQKLRLSVKNAKGKLTFGISSEKLKKRVKISSKGYITLKRWKNAKKGSYRITVKVTAAGNSAYLPKTIKRSFRIRLK